MPRKTLKQRKAEQDVADLIGKGDDPILSNPIITQNRIITFSN